MYYTGEERLVSLDALKLYRGEDVIYQNPEDIDPDQWLDNGELMELPQIPRAEAEERVGIEAEAEADTGPYLEIPIISEKPEVIARREGIHERIQAEIHHKDKQAEVLAEEMLEAPPAWSEVPDLMIGNGKGQKDTGSSYEAEEDEVTRGRRKQRREDEIRP